MIAKSFNSHNYRYGFNGKELDPEGMGGGGSTYDYGFRIYNPAIAKFLSIDPLYQKYPFYTPYQFASNTPISAIDIDGLEANKLWNAVEWIGEKTMEYVVDPMIETGKAGANLASTFGTGVYNAATVYIPQTFGFEGGEEANLRTTEGTYKWGSHEGQQVVYNSAGTVGKEVLVSAGTGVAGKVVAPLAKPVLQKVGQLEVVSNVLNSGFPQFILNKSAYKYIADAPLHHILTNKHLTKWTPKFEAFLKNAGLTFESTVNKVYVKGHYGPHPPEYHEHVYNLLVNATKGLKANTKEYKEAVVKVLADVAEEAQKAGTQVNKWLTEPR
jgi:RHS repeat-associated protein